MACCARKTHVSIAIMTRVVSPRLLWFENLTIVEPDSKSTIQKE
jgi:hypothetical protein